MHTRTSDFTCPGCVAFVDRSEQEKTEGNYYYCGNCHTVTYRCKGVEEKARCVASVLDKDVWELLTVRKGEVEK